MADCSPSSSQKRKNDRTQHLTQSTKNLVHATAVPVFLSIVKRHTMPSLQKILPCSDADSPLTASADASELIVSQT